MAAERPRGLLLDAMGTLIGLRRSVGHTYAAAACRHGLSLDAEALNAAFRRVFAAAPPLAFPSLQGAALRQAEQDWWTARVNASLAAVGVEQPPADLGPELFHCFADAALWQPYPEVPPLLQRWHGQGLKLAVVSNFDSRLEPLLEQLGLRRWLDAVVVSSGAGAAKPEPAPLLLALGQLELPGSAVWHVGDSHEDEAAAAAAGLRCVRVQRP